jgi:hypothetical protein
MKNRLVLAASVALVLSAIQARSQSITFNFEDLTDQGFGHKFSNDASETFPIVSIGGSLRMAVLRNGDFQEADRGGSGDAFFTAMNAAMLNPSSYNLSYDWYVDTTGGGHGTFLQLGTYINSGIGTYVQDFPGTGKDVELNGTQLASGGVFSGTVSETITQKYGVLDPGFQGQSFLRFGLIMNGDGALATVYYDNITLTPVPEPASLSLLALSAPALWMIRRRRSTHR